MKRVDGMADRSSEVAGISEISPKETALRSSVEHSESRFGAELTGQAHLATEDQSLESAEKGSLLRNRDFNLLLGGRTLALIGSAMSGLALTLLGYDLTKSTTTSSIMSGAFMLGTALASIPAGVYADRYDRQKIMVSSQVVWCALVGSIWAGASIHKLTVPYLAAVALAGGALTSFYAPAESASLRRIVNENQLPSAVAMNQARSSLANVAGPPIAGILYSVSRGTPFLIDACFALVSGLMAILVRTDLKPYSAAKTSFTSDMREGFSYLRGKRDLVSLASMACLANFGMTSVIFVAIFDMQRHHVHPTVIGMLETAAGLAGVAGTLLGAPVIGKIHLGRLVAATMSIVTLLCISLMYLSSTSGTILMIGIIMLFLPVVNAGLGAYFIARVTDEMQGRAGSSLNLLCLISMPPATLISGYLLDKLGRATAIFPGALSIAVVVAIALLSPAIHQLPKPSGATR